MPLYLRLLMISGSPDEVAAAAKGHVEQLDRLNDNYAVALIVDDSGSANLTTIELP